MPDLIERLHRRLPIWNAGMGGGLAGAELAAAVTNGDGFGVLGTGALPGPLAAAYLEQTRALTSGPYGANIILPMSDGSDIEACFDAAVPVLILFWGDPQPFVADAHRRGMAVVAQVGDADEAVAAADAGVDAVMLQGSEAGGHVKATRPLAETLPRVVAALGPVPVIAAGGMATGADIAAALALGARAVSLGTRFLATRESRAHAEYKARVLGARAADTVMTELFDLGWPKANHRVLRNATYERWERAGRPASGQRPGEGDTVGRLAVGAQTLELPRYTVMPPIDGFDGDFDAMPLYAGESVERIEDAPAVADLLLRLHAELRAATS